MRSITLNVTNACNLNCKYCFENDKTKEYMSIETALKAVEDVYEEKMQVMFFGGEPLLNFSVIKAVVEKYPNLRYGITTNLTLLTDDMIKFIKEYGIFILISFDGIKEIHDKNRSGSHDIIVKNALKLYEAKLSHLLQVRMTILPEDIPYVVDGIKHIVNDLKVSNIAPVLVTDRPYTKEQLNTIDTMVNDIFAYAFSLYDNPDNKINLAIKVIEDFFEKYVDLEEVHNRPCGFGSDLFYAVAPDGKVYPCHQRPAIDNMRDELCIGTVGNVGKNFGEISNMNWTPEKGDCKNCRAASICAGWCPSQSIDQFGNMNTVPESVCRYYQAVYDTVKKYHQKILNAKNLRSRRLQRVKFNLELLKLLRELQDTSTDNESFLPKLVDFYSMLNGNHELLLPDFKKHFEIKFKQLTDMLKVVK